MPLQTTPLIVTPPPLAGWLILGGLLLYGGSSLFGDVRRVLGAGAPGDNGPLITLPLALVVLGVGLALFATRR